MRIRVLGAGGDSEPGCREEGVIAGPGARRRAELGISIERGRRAPDERRKPGAGSRGNGWPGSRGPGTGREVKARRRESGQWWAWVPGTITGPGTGREVKARCREPAQWGPPGEGQWWTRVPGTITGPGAGNRTRGEGPPPEDKKIGN
ncbi:unnamed protein product [Linum trigynum]|uniref:Uncharacterized protein n=1 Tax=Linum trigynum TaxID=586398 RepID=A0AAV2GNA9_9ROSI